MTADWIAGPGTFWTLGLGGVGFAAFYGVLAFRLGRATRSEPDGCLLAICNVALVIVGGAAGFVVTRFPLQLLTSVAGAGILPGIMTLAWIRRQGR